jgi:hypothetical protein
LFLGVVLRCQRSVTLLLDAGASLGFGLQVLEIEKLESAVSKHWPRKPGLSS